MCLIIHKPNANDVMNDDYIDQAEIKNPDGFGITFLDNGETRVTMDYEEARRYIYENRPFVAHYRYATRGAINIDNCHPFRMRNGQWLYSNGTIAHLGEATKTSDTLEAVKILNQISPKHWASILSFTDTRFAIVHKDLSVSRHGKWHNKEGIYYSKDHCFSKWNQGCGYYDWTMPSRSKPYEYKYKETYKFSRSDYDLAVDEENEYNDKETYKYSEVALDKEDELSLYEKNELNLYENYPAYSDPAYSVKPTYPWHSNSLVAVYGTLKKGKSNNSVLGDSKLVGKGVTATHYPLQVKGVPYVFKIPNKGYKIDVEVYDVKEDFDKVSIDILEGHPSHYCREQTSIELDDGRIINAWLYFATRTTDYEPTMKIQACY